MASKRREFSSLPTLLLSLVIGTVLGVLLLLLFGRHVGNPDTVSAVNAGIPGTTVIDRNENTGNKAAANSTANTASTTTAAGDTTTASGTAATTAATGAAATGTTATGTATADNASKTPVEGQAAAGSAGAAATAAAQPGAAPAQALEQTVTDTSFHGTGAEIYVQACQSCHMPGGKGARGAGIYPALANNPKLKAMQYPTGMVLYGNGGMPSFGHYMNDQQISDVVNYIRTELNKNTDKVTPDDVKKMRQPGQHYMIFGEAAG